MDGFTTMEHLQLDLGCDSSVVRFDDFVLAAYYTWKGTYTAEVYEFIDEPGTDFSEIECRLSIINKKEGFKDAGHALLWAIENRNN